jgi:hypothetical protein
MTRKREAGRQKQARASGLTRGGTEATSGRHSVWKEGGAGARHGRGGGEQEAMLWKKGSHCGREQDLAPSAPRKPPGQRDQAEAARRPPVAARSTPIAAPPLAGQVLARSWNPTVQRCMR